MTDHTIALINNELGYARRVYPDFPRLTGDAVLIMAEEAGETIKAANDHDRAQVIAETIQTAAMCVRILEEWAQPQDWHGVTRRATYCGDTDIGVDTTP